MFALLLSTAVSCTGEQEQEEKQPKFRILGGASTAKEPTEPQDDPSENPEHGADVSSRSRETESEKPSILAAMPAHQGSTFLVGGNTSSDNENGMVFPIEELQQVFARAEPGDRIVLRGGSYLGPIHIDAPHRNGRPGMPIQVVALEDAVLTLAKNQEARAILEVDRSYWHFYGLEVTAPQSKSGGILVRTSKETWIIGAHIHELASFGIRLEGGVGQFSLADTHIHQVGFGRFATPSPGLDVTSAKTHVEVSNTRIHHVPLTPLRHAGTPWRELRLATQGERPDGFSFGNLEIRQSRIQ